jgi:hypothetical protein
MIRFARMSPCGDRYSWVIRANDAIVAAGRRRRARRSCEQSGQAEYFEQAGAPIGVVITATIVVVAAVAGTRWP